jgi:hypothetical protein
MKASEIIDGLLCLSPRMLSLALRSPSQLPHYVSYCLKKYDELVGNGLPSAGPVTPAEHLTISLPAFHAGGGMTFTEVVILARVTKAIQPRTVFEMGTYNGLTTAVFLLNSDPEARVVSLDLPVDSMERSAEIASDSKLVESRRLGWLPKALQLRPYTQLLCDSMVFDPSPYLNSVDLGLVDAAHDFAHVQNDTIKMAGMMSDTGICFWHDYGGKGALRPLARYLNRLGKRGALYRIPDTSLAWSLGRELKKALGLLDAEVPVPSHCQPSIQCEDRKASSRAAAT